jgi:hypothetical protein
MIVSCVCSLCFPLFEKQQQKAEYKKEAGAVRKSRQKNRADSYLFL